MLLQRLHASGIHHLGHLRACAAGGLGKDVALFLLTGVIHPHMQQEAVQLRFGQWVRAGLFDRVLRGQHEERRRQRIGGAGITHRAFAHRFQQCGLGLGRGAIEFVGQQQIGKDRPLLEAKMPMPGAVVFFQQLGAQDVAGHQVGGELHAAELQVQCLPQRAHQQRLAQARRAFQQAMAAGEQADQQLLHHRVLAHHRLGQGGAQRAQLGELRGEDVVVGGGHGQVSL